MCSHTGRFLEALTRVGLGEKKSSAALQRRPAFDRTPSDLSNESCCV